LNLNDDIAVFMRCYPQIYFACHRRHVRDKAARRILGANQSSILDHLDAVEPTPLHALARHMGVTASTMSLNIDRLERAGYVKRSRDSHDARRVALRLTVSGNKLKQQQQALDPTLVSRLLERLPPGDRVAAINGLRLLAMAAKSDPVLQKSRRSRKQT
jgi:MarR family transcriptional regulator, organic hydroperoxide resistance regulator